jgi:hypothetical protein
MDRHSRLSERSRPMRLLLSLFLVALVAGCSSQKKAKYNPAEDTQWQTPAGYSPDPVVVLKPDETVANVTGCSSSQSPSEKDTVSYPPLVPGAGRAAMASEVQLGIQAGGVWTSHNLTHPCCTKAKVFVQRVMGQVNFIETIEGTPCGDGCMCGSQVQSAAGATPGRYYVTLRLEDPAGSTIVKQSNFVVENR